MKNKRSGIAFGSPERALLVYRVFAFITGTVLLAGTMGLIVEAISNAAIDKYVGPLWLVHGYIFMAYALVAVNLALHMRLTPVKTAALVAAGTIPTMSFVAERAVYKAAARPNHSFAVSNKES